MSLEAVRHIPNWLMRNVPDPCTPLSHVLSTSQLRAGPGWVAQRQRRSNILAAARLLMARSSLEEVHLQEVASHCGISVPTIYNIIGRRAEMMDASAREWVAAIAAVARRDAEALGTNAIYTMLAMCWSSALTESSYVDSAVRSNLSTSAPLRQAFLAAGTREHLHDFIALQRAGAVREGVDIAALSRQLAMSAYATICNFAVDRYDVEHFRRELAFGPGLMLMGALVGDQRVCLERQIFDEEAGSSV